MRLAVVGLGAASPLGRSAGSVAAAVRGGISAYRRHPWLRAQEGTRVTLAFSSWLPQHLDPLERMLTLAHDALAEALSPVSALSAEVRPPLSLHLGVPAPRPGLPEGYEEGARRYIEGWIGEHPASPRLVGARAYAQGHASFFAALGAAREELSSGGAELALVGGLDSYVHADTLAHFDREQRLRTPRVRYGFTPGEGAGFCLIAGEATARRLGLEARATLLAIAEAKEPAPIGSGKVCTGVGLSEVLRRLAAELPEGEKIRSLFVDLNGEPYRVDELGFALTRSARSVTQPPSLEVPGTCWGDVGAASGPLCLAVAAHRPYHPILDLGSPVLISASSDGGERGGALIELPARTSGPS